MNRLLLSVLFVVCTFAQVVAGGGKPATFKVSGNCGMCERKIEGAATSLKGVKSAAWSQETKALVVVYNEKLVKLVKKFQEQNELSLTEFRVRESEFRNSAILFSVKKLWEHCQIKLSSEPQNVDDCVKIMGIIFTIFGIPIEFGNSDRIWKFR